MGGVFPFTGYGSWYNSLPSVNRLNGSSNNWIDFRRLLNLFLVLSDLQPDFQYFCQPLVLADKGKYLLNMKVIKKNQLNLGSLCGSNRKN